MRERAWEKASRRAWGGRVRRGLFSILSRDIIEIVMDRWQRHGLARRAGRTVGDPTWLPLVCVDRELRSKRVTPRSMLDQVAGFRKLND